jgi:hypothetical protein
VILIDMILGFCAPITDGPPIYSNEFNFPKKRGEGKGTSHTMFETGLNIGAIAYCRE